MKKNIEGVLIRYHREKQNITQEQLALDICTPSYLSKIEAGSANPDPSLIKLIFKKLNIEYHDDSEFLQKGQKLLNSFFHELIFFGDKRSCFDKIKGQKTAFLHSTLMIQYLEAESLNEADIELYMEKVGGNAPVLSQFTDSMTETELAGYYLIKACYCSDDETQSESYFEKSQVYSESSYGMILWFYEYYIKGSYNKIFDRSASAVSLAAAEGNVMAMIHLNLLVANSLACIGKTDEMFQYYKRAENLLSVTNKESLKFTIQINLMSAYKLTRDYDKALKYYEKARKIQTEPDMTYYLELKAADMYLQAGSPLKAKEHYKISEHFRKEISLSAVEKEQHRLIEIKLEDTDYKKNPEYLSILEDLVFVQSKGKQRAFYYDYKGELEEEYCFLRKYKQAYMLSRDFPEKC